MLEYQRSDVHVLNHILLFVLYATQLAGLHLLLRDVSWICAAMPWELLYRDKQEIVELSRCWPVHVWTPFDLFRWFQFVYKHPRVINGNQTWRAGTWTIEIGDVPIRNLHSVRGFSSTPRLMKPEGNIPINPIKQP